MKERGCLKELVAVSCGPEKCSETLRVALAMGADRAIHIKTDMRTDQSLQPLAVAKLLQKMVEKEEHSNDLQTADGPQAARKSRNKHSTHHTPKRPTFHLV